MILERLEQKEQFTGQEQAVAGYILEHGDQVQNMSTDELAKASYTSKATVVRLCKKLGIDSYQELKLKLVSEMVQRVRINQLLKKEPITEESSYEDINDALPKLYDKAISETVLCLDKNAVKRIVDRMKKADKITFYGSGISYIVAQAAAFKFATLGLDADASESVNAHYLAASARKEVAVLVSFTGANTNMISVARYLKKTTDCYVVGVAGRHNREMREWCNEMLEVPSRDSLMSLKVVTSFTASNYILDLLFSMLLASSYERHVKTALKMVSRESLRTAEEYWKLGQVPGSRQEDMENNNG